MLIDIKQHSILEVVADHVLDLITLTDMKGRILFAGGAYQDILGHRPAQMKGANFTDLLHPQDITKFQTAMKELRERGTEEIILQVRCFQEDGSYRWMEVFGKSVNWRGHAQGEILLISREATQGSYRMNHIINATKIGVWEWRSSRGDIVVNKILANMLGYELEEIVAMNVSNLSQFFYPSDWIEVEAFLTGKGRMEEKGCDTKLRLKHRTGHWIWVYHKMCVVFRTKMRNPYWVCSVIMQVPAPAEAEIELINKERLMKKLSEFIPGFWHEFKLRKDGSTCFPFFSEGISDMYALKPEELQQDASKVFDRIHPEDVKRVYRRMKESAGKRTLWKDVYRYEHPHKGERWIQVKARPEIQEDDSVLWYGYLVDITAEKASEENVNQSNKLLQAILDHVPFGIWLSSPAGDPILMNQWCRQHFSNYIWRIGSMQEKESGFYES